MLKFVDNMNGKTFYPINEVAGIVGALLQVIRDPAAEIGTLAYDSRKLHHIPQALFFAIRGRRDGHDFVNHAYSEGVRSFVVSDTDRVTVEAFPEANFLIVNDTLRALQDLALHHRTQFSYPVLAITGSNGKTVVKDWLYQLLSPERRIVRSPKSFNSQLGVALSLWEMDARHEMAIIEAGISRRGEMERLSEIIRPDIAILTNVGTAHQEGFTDFEEKKQEKLRLLKGAAKTVFPGDRVGVLPDADAWDWGEGEGSRLQILEQIRGSQSSGSSSTRIRARLRGETEAREIIIPFTDAASIENAITCWTVMLLLNYEQTVIAERMARLQVMEMRLEMKRGIRRSTIIDDSYSNDLSSLTIALDLLKQQHQHPLKTLILSDMPHVDAPVESTCPGPVGCAHVPA